MFKKINSYLQETRTEIINADENTRFKPFSLASLMTLHRRDVDLFENDKGVGPWQNFNQGRVRLISPTTGFKGMKELFAVIHFQTQKNVQIKEINIVPHNPDNIIDSVRMPVINGKRGIYKDEFMIPLQLKTPQKWLWDIALDVRFQACYEGVCQEEKSTLPLLLTNESAYPSVLHSAILFSLRHVPQDWPAKNPFYWNITQNKVYIQADFPRKIERLSVLLPDDSVADLDLFFLDKKRVRFIFSIPESMAQKPEFPIVLLTDKGYFYHPISRQYTPFQPKTEIPFFLLLKSTFLFLCCCPFLFFCLHPSKNKIAVIKKELKQIILLIGLFFILFFFCWICGFQNILNLFQTSFLWAVICLFAVWYLLRDFKNLSAVLLFILWIILPKEFLQNLFDHPFNTKQILGICLFWMALFISIPALILWKVQKIKKTYKYLNKMIPVFKLPFHVILFFGVISVVGNFYINQKIPLYKDIKNTLTDSNKTVVLFVEHPVSLTGFINKLWGTTTGKMRHKDKNSLMVTRLSLTGKEADTFFKQHVIFPQYPFVWIYQPKKNYQKIILNNGKYTYLSGQLANILP